MQLRNLAWVITILSLSALSACRGKSSQDSEQAEQLLSMQESEPNNTRDQCTTLGTHPRVEGTLTGADIDVVCATNDSRLDVLAPATVSMALESPEGQRVELGPGTGNARSVEFPSNRWTLELRGEGAWTVSRPESDEEPSPFCGIRLGTAAEPVVLGVQSLPAEFPLCADAANGAAKVLFPSIRPEGVAGFEMRIDGLDEETRGLLRVLDEGKAIAHTELALGKRLPGLRWLSESLLEGELSVVRRTGPKTVMLRIEAVLQPDSAQSILELEPNDAELNAVPVSGQGVVAGSLYHLQDIDRFRVAEFAGDLGLELMTQPNTKLHVLSSTPSGTQEAVLGEDGVYRICSLADAPMTPVDVRVAYGDAAEATDGVYQLSFVPAASKTDEPLTSEPLSIPLGDPSHEFGFVRQPAEEHPNLRGRIFPPDDVDEWLFQIPPSATDYHVAIDIRSKSAMDVKVRVLDADRVVVGTADRGAAGQSERLELELPTGFYILEVRASGVRNCEGAYELGISSPNARPAPSGVPGGDWREIQGDHPPQYIRPIGRTDSEGEDSPPTQGGPSHAPKSEPAPKQGEDAVPAYPW